eukprot:8715645-Pyramimonas_sp.AAC.1
MPLKASPATAATGVYLSPRVASLIRCSPTSCNASSFYYSHNHYYHHHQCMLLRPDACLRRLVLPVVRGCRGLGQVDRERLGVQGCALCFCAPTSSGRAQSAAV